MKKTKVLIIAIISIVLIICGIVAYLFVTTDIFKSKKKVFNNLASQINLKEFVEFSSIETYAKKLVEEPSKNEGNIKIVVDDALNEEISYTINTNPSAKKANGEISLSQDEQEGITAKFIINEDVYGIQCVFKQFLVLKNKDLKKFAKTLEMDDESIPDKIEMKMPELKIDEEVLKLTEDAEKILKKYGDNILKQIPDKNYKRISNAKIEVDGKTIAADGYKIVLNGDEIKSIIKSSLELIKEDQELFSLINAIQNLNEKEEVTWEEYQSFFSSFDMDDIEIEPSFKLSIILYKQGKKLVKTDVKLENTQDDENQYIELFIENNTIKIIIYEDSTLELQYLIKRINADGETGYKIEFCRKEDEDEEKIDALITLKNENNKKYVFTFDLVVEGQDINPKISIINTTNFENDIQIEELDKDNMVIINDLSKEQLESIMNTFGTEISKKIDISKTILWSYFNDGLFTKAKTATMETRKSQVKEAMALAKADIYAMYYDPMDTEHYLNTTPPNDKEMQELINYYINSYELSVTVTGPTTNENGTVYTIKIDQEDEQPDLKLDSTENTIVCDMWKSE